MGGELSARTLGYGMLDRDHLTKHLFELAQRVGVAKVTMRGLASQAGTSTSSVYYHVAGKAELLDLLIEAVVNSIEVPTKGEWQERVVALYTNAWRVLVTVRGIAGLLQQRPTHDRRREHGPSYPRHPARIWIVQAGFHRRVRPALRAPARFGGTRAQSARARPVPRPDGPKRRSATDCRSFSPAFAMSTKDEGKSCLKSRSISPTCPCGPTASPTTYSRTCAGRIPVYHQSRTAIVDKCVGREFWVCTKHAEVTQVHRDHDAFTATDGPLIQEVSLFSAYPAIVNLDPPDHTKRRRTITKAFTPRAVVEVRGGHPHPRATHGRLPSWTPAAVSSLNSRRDFRFRSSETSWVYPTMIDRGCLISSTRCSSWPASGSRRRKARPWDLFSNCSSTQAN